ncbi:hypothetical protein TIFTF001_032013 [Ficus carica]|uniref:Uncharacterized protein n=1 Tax=Ficus carica TaxID=3494 RepID=A0AA88J1U9_FICCA|nr:hypothetical protein TIFTF001_032013 [Ficus carica]
MDQLCSLTASEGRSRCGSQPSPISTIDGAVVSCAGASLLTRSVTRWRLGGDRGGGRRSRCGSQPSSISTIEGEVASCAGASSLTKSVARRSLEGDCVADLNRHRFPPSEVRT